MGSILPIAERLRRARDAQAAAIELAKSEPPKGRAHAYWIIKMRKFLLAVRRNAAALLVGERYGKHPRYPRLTAEQESEAEALIAWADARWKI